MASVWNCWNILTNLQGMCDIYLCFDLYFEYSTTSSARAARATTTRINQLQSQTPLSNRKAVLKTSANKAQLNAFISNEILNDNAFLKSATASHQLVVTGEKTNPVQVFKGHIFPRRDLSTTHEKADTMIAQYAIHISKEDLQSKVRVVSDDTDVFALLVYFYSTRCLQTSMTMQSPFQDCYCIDVMETPWQAITQSHPLMVLVKQQQLL